MDVSIHPCSFSRDDPVVSLAFYRGAFGFHPSAAGPGAIGEERRPIAEKAPEST